jgi:4-hydroxybenzoate polyprenyltransferase
MTRAVVASAAAHVVTVVALGIVGACLHRGALYAGAVAGVALLLAYEHALVGKGNLAKIDRAFFDINAYVSVGFFTLTLADALVEVPL